VTVCSCAIPIRRAWAMPSADTFSIPPIADLLDRWLDGRAVIVDPFARNSKRVTITNDLNPETSAQHHMTADDFGDKLVREGTKADAVLFDPPYSSRQMLEVYQSVGLEFGIRGGQVAPRFKDARDHFAEIVKPGGVALCFGWNSIGFGKGRGFTLAEVLIVCHGGAHNDTIVTVEEKLPNLFDQGDQ
jgi:hypothetical protein